jgi:hypothetical protein
MRGEQAAGVPGPAQCQGPMSISQSTRQTRMSSHDMQEEELPPFIEFPRRITKEEFEAMTPGERGKFIEETQNYIHVTQKYIAAAVKGLKILNECEEELRKEENEKDKKKDELIAKLLEQQKKGKEIIEVSPIISDPSPFLSLFRESCSGLLFPFRDSSNRLGN